MSSEQPREARFFENRPEGQSAVVTRLRWNLDLMQIEKLVDGVYAKVSQEEDDYWTEEILFETQLPYLIGAEETNSFKF